MSDLDILEFLAAPPIENFQNPPTAIAVNVDLAEGTVWQRARVLNAADLIERTDEDRGYYKITNMGRRYLAGELTDDERQKLKEFDPSDI